MTDENSNLNRPTPIDIEVTWDKNQTIVSKSDLFGTIDYANEAFANVSGYEEYELVGKAHSLIRHPDMPKIIYKILWDNLKLGKAFRIIFKNLAKSGQYYWVVSDFEYNKDADGNVIEYVSRRNAVESEVIDTEIAPLYKKLLQIEQASGLKYSEKYLTGFLEEKGLNFEDYTKSLVNVDIKTQQLVEKSQPIVFSEPEKLQETQAVELQIVEDVKTFEEPTIVEVSELIEQITPLEEVKVVETIPEPNVVENLEIVPEMPISETETKTEIKKEVAETNDFGSADHEEVQRETRSGFIGKLFGRE